MLRHSIQFFPKKRGLWTGQTVFQQYSTFTGSLYFFLFLHVEAMKRSFSFKTSRPYKEIFSNAFSTSRYDLRATHHSFLFHHNIVNLSVVLDCGLSCTLRPSSLFTRIRANCREHKISFALVRKTPQQKHTNECDKKNSQQVIENKL